MKWPSDKDQENNGKVMNGFKRMVKQIGKQLIVMSRLEKTLDGKDSRKLWFGQILKSDKRKKDFEYSKS